MQKRVFGHIITKTCLYISDPLKPHFYIVKLGFTGIIFLISVQKHRLWVLVRTASPEAVLTSTHNLCFEQKYEKYQSFLSENFQFLDVKFSIYLNRRVFVMCRQRRTRSTCNSRVHCPLTESLDTTECINEQHRPR